MRIDQLFELVDILSAEEVADSTSADCNTAAAVAAVRVRVAVAGTFVPYMHFVHLLHLVLIY